MATQVDIPGVGIVEFPDEMSHDDIKQAIERDILPKYGINSPKDEADQANGRSVAPNALEKYVTDPLETAGAATLEGLRRTGAGIGQVIYPGIDKLLGTSLEPALEAERKPQKEAFEKKYGDDPYARFGASAVELLPYLAMPGGEEAKLAEKILSGSVGGGIIGGTQEQDKEDPTKRLESMGLGALTGGATTAALSPALEGLMSSSPTKQAATGATLGGLLGLATGTPEHAGLLAAIGGAIPTVPKQLYGMSKNKIADLLNRGTAKQVTPYDIMVASHVSKGTTPERYAERMAAAKRLDVPITPAEADPSSITGKTQGQLGSTVSGALSLRDFEEMRSGKEEKAIDDLLNKINPKTNNANEAIRETAKSILDLKRKDMLKEAEPLYDAALYDEDGNHRIISDPAIKKMFENPVIQYADKRMISEPGYKLELENVPKNSVQYLDMIKRTLDDKIGVLKSSGNNNLARIYRDTKNEMVDIMDDDNPDYKDARRSYAEKIKPIEKLKMSDLGRIADLKDTQIKNVSSILFDNKQTDPKVFNKLRDEISKVNPDAWTQITRNEMENRLDKINSNYGKNFYKKVLADKRSFNKFMSALDKNPAAQQKLIDMRTVFRDLQNPKTATTAKAQAESNIDMVRNAADAVVKWLKGTAGKQYEQSAIKLITNPDWDKELEKIKKIPDKTQRAIRITHLLSRIGSKESAQLPEKEEEK